MSELVRGATDDPLLSVEKTRDETGSEKQLSVRQCRQTRCVSCGSLERRTEETVTASHPKTPSIRQQRLFTVAAAAKYLGISDDSLRKYSDLGYIPVYRNPLNGHRAFKLEDLNRWIDNLPPWNDARSDTTRAGRERDVS